MPSKYSSLIAQMTLEEKASLLSGADFWRTRGIKWLNVPQMAFADGPHGLRKQASEGDHLGLVKGVEATCFPTSATLANSWDRNICHLVGETIGKEAVYQDVNVVLGPGLNIKRSPLCGRNFEYFSEDPYLSGKLAAAFVNGVQSQGVGACLKHFAANNQEYLRMTSDSIVDLRTLHEIYLTGFEIATKEGKPKVVMSSYNKINGVYAHENNYLLREVLVNRWNFDGFVVSDWGGSNDAVSSVIAGAHVEMPSTGYDSIWQITEAVRTGKLEESILDERVDEFLNILYSTEIKHKEAVDFESHHQIAQRAAEASAVLLKNDGVLPLGSEQRVAIIGDFAKLPRYQGAGSSMVNPYKLESTVEKIADSGLNIIGFAEGFDRNGAPCQTKLDEAIRLAENADVVLLYIGLNEVDEVEGHDRSHLSILQNQIDLIHALSQVKANLVAVVSCGSVIEMPWRDECDAILHGYLAGQAGATALFNLLSGKVNPSGKLSETYPVKLSDVPNQNYYPGKEKTSEYREGLYVGYRYYDKANSEVLFPFGFGLSYTTFEYSGLTITDEGVSIQVKNTGSRVGSEIVQLYIGKEQNRIYRPIKELKGFKKVEIQPGETVCVEIPFDDYSFRYFDTHFNRFVTEKGSYTCYVGSSSRDIHVCGQIEIEGVEPIGDDSVQLEKYYRGEVKDLSAKEFERLYGKALPNPNWEKQILLGLNDSLAQMVHAKSALARFAIKGLIHLRNRSVKKGKPDLNLFFLTNMPFRAIAKMSNGAFSIEMTEKLLVIVNGHFFKGVGGLIQSFFKYRKRGLKS